MSTGENIRNIILYIEETKKDELKDIPVEGVFITSVKIDNRETVEVWKHGKNDYAACFIDGDWSASGTLDDIVGEIVAC